MTNVSPFNIARRLLARVAQGVALVALSSTVAQSGAAKNYVVGYWEGSGTPDVSHLTHLNYAFASIVLNSGSYTCKLSTDAGKLTGEFRSFKTANPELKILVSVGGAGQNPIDFTNASQDPNFASNCVADTLGKLGNAADGIDVDWEFPTSSDPQNFTNLMTALRDALPQNGLLTAVVGVGPADNGKPAQNAYIPFADVLDVVDFFNVASYHMYSTEKTTFGAPLFAPSIQPYGTYNGTVDGTITDLISNRSVPAGKLVLGIPFYGVSYPSVPVAGANFGLYEPPVLEMVPNPKKPGQTEAVYALAVPYNQIAPQVGESTITKLCDTGLISGVVCPQTWGDPLANPPTSGSQETWIYNPNSQYGFGPSVTTFDDGGSVAAKVEYALNKELAGVMVWELMQDTSDHELLNTIANCMPAPLPPADLSTYNFENGTQGWTTSSPYTWIASSDVKPFLGSRSLQIVMGTTDENGDQEYSPVTKVYIASPAIESTSRSVTLNIWIPSDAVIDSINPFIADRSWHFLASAWTSSYTANAWNTFVIQIPAGAQAAYLGIEFKSSIFWAGTLYLDSIDVE